MKNMFFVSVLYCAVLATGCGGRFLLGAEDQSGEDNSLSGEEDVFTDAEGEEDIAADETSEASDNDDSEIDVVDADVEQDTENTENTENTEDVESRYPEMPLSEQFESLATFNIEIPELPDGYNPALANSIAKERCAYLALGCDAPLEALDACAFVMDKMECFSPDEAGCSLDVRKISHQGQPRFQGACTALEAVVDYIQNPSSFYADAAFSRFEACEGIQWNPYHDEFEDDPEQLHTDVFACEVQPQEVEPMGYFDRLCYAEALCGYEANLGGPEMHTISPCIAIDSSLDGFSSGVRIKDRFPESAIVKDVGDSTHDFFGHSYFLYDSYNYGLESEWVIDTYRHCPGYEAAMEAYVSCVETTSCDDPQNIVGVIQPPYEPASDGAPGNAPTIENGGFAYYLAYDMFVVTCMDEASAIRDITNTCE